MKARLALALGTALVLSLPSLAQTGTPGADSPVTTGAVTGSNAGASGLRQLTVDALEDMDLVAADGKEIGEIEGVVEGQDGKRFVIIERGGVLGIGAREIAIPIENLAVQGERLVLRNMDVAALDALPAYKNDNKAFRELGEDQQIGLAHQ